jgi:RNA polymerase sigma factor (sigma-70 family)
LNIDPAAEPDPWPRRGLAAAYKPFILKRIGPFLQNNRHLNRNEVITDAIRITWEASQKFKPELGYDFSTYLRHLLPNRLYDLYRIEKSEKLETEMELPVRLVGTCNGAGLILDTGFLAIGVKTTGNDQDYLTGVLERIRADMGAVPPNHENFQAFMRAIVDHSERREREALAEAEQGGVVLFEPRDLQADVKCFGENRLLRFKPAIVDRAAIPAGYQLDRMSKGSRIICRAPPAQNGSDPAAAARLNKLITLAGLTAREQSIVMHMCNPHHTDTEFAKSTGISQGHLSKLKAKIVQKMRVADKKLRDAQDAPEAWHWIDPTKFFGEDNDD